MKFTSTITAAVLGLASTITAAPIDGQTIVPDLISLYHGKTGQIEYNVKHGKISRVQNGNDDISVLVQIYFPESTRNRKCEFRFELDNTYTFQGAYIDVFKSSQYPTSSSPGWGAPSNYRDTQLGRLRPVAGGNAKVEWGSFQFECPTGKTVGFEVTPTGDATLVEWDEAVDGPWVAYW